MFIVGIWDVFFRKSYYPIAYEEEVSLASSALGVDEAVIYATIYCESSFNKEAVSNMDARGLMQILPETFEWLCELEGFESDTELLFDPQINVYYGTKFLSILYERYGNWDVAHAAYHAGHGRVDKWLENGEVVIDADGALTGIPIDATRVYVERINRAKSGYIKLLEDKES
jgi:soluble lytic murein transglycosylase